MGRNEMGRNEMEQNEMKNLYFAKPGAHMLLAKRNGTKRNEKYVLCQTKWYETK